MNKLESLHAWLYAPNGSTLQEIADELRGLRSVAGLEPYKNLPADAGELLNALMELQRAGLARVDSDGRWWWNQPPVKAEPQERLLFA